MGAIFLYLGYLYILGRGVKFQKLYLYTYNPFPGTHAYMDTYAYGRNYVIYTAYRPKRIRARTDTGRGYPIWNTPFKKYGYVLSGQDSNLHVQDQRLAYTRLISEVRLPHWLENAQPLFPPPDYIVLFISQIQYPLLVLLQSHL